MPDPIESAFQKVVENAEANCPFDTLRPWVIEDVGANRIVNTMNDCTCDATIDAAAEAMLAAATAIGHNPRYPLTEQGIEDSLAGKHDEQTCSACQVEATIKRLREEAK